MVSEREVEELRAFLPDVLRELCGVTDLRREFRCPLPSHEDRGPSAHYYENGYTIHCFGCGETRDVFSLVGELQGIDSFPEQVKAVADLVGYTLSDDDGAARPVAKRKPKPRPLFDKPKKAGGADCSEACGAAWADFYLPGNEAGLEWLRTRGFDDDDASRWGLGFTRFPRSIMPEFKVSEPGAAGFVSIPFWSRDFKEARYCMLRTVPGLGEVRNKEWKPAGIGSPLWREWLLWSAAPVVMVTEGLLDAMALDKMLRRGGPSVGIEVMALGGTSNARRFSQVLYRVPAWRRPRKVIVAMDEDGAGRSARDGLCRDLALLGVAHEANPPWPGGAKDADEWLMSGRGVTWEFYEKGPGVGASGPVYGTRWL